LKQTGEAGKKGGTLKEQGTADGFRKKAGLKLLQQNTYILKISETIQSTV